MKRKQQRADARSAFPALVRMMFLLVLLLGSGLRANAATDIIQQSERNISGVVTDENKDPLIGVAIVVKGTNVGTTTNLDGEFTLKVPAGAKTLKLSYVGMKTVELPLAGKSRFDVQMETDAVLVEDVVVIGYGTRAKKDLSMSVASLSGETLNDRPSAFNILQGVAGKVAGAEYISMSGRPGGNSALRIRGIGSINASATPLYVVDGVVDVGFNQINPADVESMEVLKDAAATSMYGSKGANGVVLITTKQGKKGKGNITYEGKMGFGFLSRKLDLLNSEEYLEVQKRAYAYSGQVMPHLTTPMENLFYYAKDGENYKYDENGLLIASPKYDTDWQDVITQTAISNDHMVSFSSGTERSSIYASLGYQNFQGIIKTTESERLSAKLNVTSQIKDWFRLQAGVLMNRLSSNTNDQATSFGQGSVRNMMEMPPIVPVKYEDGTWGRKNDYPLSEAAENPLRLLYERKDESRSDYAQFNMSATFDITKKLSLTVQGDYRISHSKDMSYAKAGLVDVSENNGGYADIDNSDTQKWSSENYLTYTDKFFGGKLSSTFMLGASWYYSHTESSSTGSEQFFDDSFGYYNLSAGTTWHEPGSGMSERTMNSYYFRMNHSFLDRYLLGFSFRADGASNFGANNKYGYFPSVSAGWRISEERFFEPLKEVVNSFKLRGSYGMVGNAGIPNYTTIAKYSSGNLTFNNQLASRVELSSLANGDLKWETSRQLDLGVDVSFWNNRVELIVDYYNKITTDMLFEKQVPYTTGYSSTWTNLGKIGNEGWEVTLTSHNIQTRDFSWTTDLVFSTNKVKVIDINGETITIGSQGIIREGEDWASYWLLKRLGTWGLSEVEEAAKYGKKPGDIKYEDVNGDYQIDDADRHIMGSGMPKGNLTMMNTFNYKGLSLMIDLNYVYGNKIYNSTGRMLERPLYNNGADKLLNSWTPENQNTMLPALRLPSDNHFAESEADSWMLEDGDFLRLRNVALSYTFPTKLLRKTRVLEGLTLGVNAENLFVLTKYSGYDPQIGSFNSDRQQSTDFYGYPRPTTITGHIKVTF